jgi:ribosomal protein S18 acetylase RimI-like enzyme
VDVRVRDAVPADAAAIADIHICTWQAAYAHIFPTDKLAALDEQRAERERIWLGWLESPWPGGSALVAEQQGRVVGFVSVGRARNDETLGELYAIYVLPDAWGGGAGAALMSQGLERLRGHFDEAILWVLEDNPRARAFYDRFGWRLDGGLLEETHLDTLVREVRYRIRLGPAG